jgi:RNA polymerase sigma factor for flagellar operon FliA
MDSANQLVEQHQGMVRTLARQLRSQLSLKCEVDELVGFGMVGLVEASRRYDAERGILFSTFAYYRVRGAMVDGIRKMAHLPRRVHAQLQSLEAVDAITEGVAEERAQPDTERADARTAAETLALTLERITAAYAMCSASAAATEESEGPEDKAIRQSSQHRIREAVQSLDPRERMLVEAFYFHGKTLEEAGKALGISKSWASRLHDKALDHLRQALHDHDVE